MGRFNWTWKTLRTLSVVMCGVWLPSTSSAFDAVEQRGEECFVHDACHLSRKSCLWTQ